jgi:hypothetical protein
MAALQKQNRLNSYTFTTHSDAMAFYLNNQDIRNVSVTFPTHKVYKKQGPQGGTFEYWEIQVTYWLNPFRDDLQD